MRTHDKKYSHEWLRILRMWIDASPYEPLDPSTPHVKTTMKWRDMQVSWRTMVLVHSIYMLGTYDDAFEYAEWKYIYDFLELNLNHLMDETTDAIKTKRYGNHILQMSSAMISAGVLMPEFPNAYKYMEQGCEMMMLCEEHKILSDGASSETCPSYCHFIARLYFEAEMHLEFNGYPQMQGMRDSVIRQYRWMAETSTRDGRTIRFNDSYDMDAHTDIRRMAEIGGFDVEFPTGSVCKEVSGYVHLRGRRLEAVLDAMDWFGGHQHFGRLQPMLWVDGKEILTEVGCTNYDNWDSFHWCKLNEAHSVIHVPSISDKEATRTVRVTAFDASLNTVTAVTEVKANDGRSYTWERTMKLADSYLDIIDTVKASEEMEFAGRYYLSARPTAMLDDFNARQVTSTALITLTCDMPMTLDRVPCLDDANKQSYAARLEYKQTAKEFTVNTRIDCTERVL